MRQGILGTGGDFTQLIPYYKRDAQQAIALAQEAGNILQQQFEIAKNNMNHDMENLATKVGAGGISELNRTIQKIEFDLSELEKRILERLNDEQILGLKDKLSHT